RHRRRRARGDCPRQCRARHDDDRHYPQRLDRRDGRRGHPSGRRPGRREDAERHEEDAEGARVVNGGLSALNRKLLRDLWWMRTQALAIALVIAAGIAMLVAYLANFDSLVRARDDFYSRQRFADVFASVRRAPEILVDRIRAIPRGEGVGTRVVAAVAPDAPGLAEPASRRLVSSPRAGRPGLPA